MARKRLPPDDPREWLNRARSNLALAGKLARPVTTRKYRRAVRIAGAVVRWAERQIGLP